MLVHLIVTYACQMATVCFATTATYLKMDVVLLKLLLHVLIIVSPVLILGSVLSVLLATLSTMVNAYCKLATCALRIVLIADLMALVLPVRQDMV